MDNIKLFAKSERELETRILTVRICSQDIGMEFGVESCTIQVMKSGKRRMTKRMELLDQEKNQNTQRKGKLQTLGDIGS